MPVENSLRTLRLAVFCFVPNQRHLLEREPVLLVVPHELRNELEEADAKGIATLTLYGLEGWQRALELARPDRVLTVGAPPELSAELQIQGYDVQQDQPESPRKAPQ